MCRSTRFAASGWLTAQSQRLSLLNQCYENLKLHICKPPRGCFRDIGGEMCQATGEWHEVRQCEHGEQGDSLLLCRRPRATSRQCFSPGWLVEQWGGDATSVFVDDGLCPCHTRADRSLQDAFEVARLHVALARESSCCCKRNFLECCRRGTTKTSGICGCSIARLVPPSPCDRMR